jgi:hypothetical protein
MPTRGDWCCSIKAVFDVIGACLGMERFEIGYSAANNPLSSVETSQVPTNHMEEPMKPMAPCGKAFRLAPDGGGI